MRNHAWMEKRSWLMLLLASAACGKGQEIGAAPKAATVAPASTLETRPSITVASGQLGDQQPERTQVSQYIRRMFQDKAGNIWFGTQDDGVVRYDGNALRYFSVEQGLAGRSVRGIVQDPQGDLWFATSGGVSRYDGKMFTNPTVRDGLADDDVWSLLLDRAGMLWIGTMGGVSRHDGSAFSNLEVSEAQVIGHAVGPMWSIFEDRDGNM